MAPFLEATAFRIVNRRRETVPYLPLALHFSVVSNCNLNCLMCNNRSLFKKYWEYLTFSDFRKMLKQVPSFTMRRASTDGIGEPLLNPDLPDIFLYAKKRGFITSTFTNATLVNEVDAASLLKGLDQIHISLDGATKKHMRRLEWAQNLNTSSTT